MLAAAMMAGASGGVGGRRLRQAGSSSTVIGIVPIKPGQGGDNEPINPFGLRKRSQTPTASSAAPTEQESLQASGGVAALRNRLNSRIPLAGAPKEEPTPSYVAATATATAATTDDALSTDDSKASAIRKKFARPSGKSQEAPESSSAGQRKASQPSSDELVVTESGIPRRPARTTITASPSPPSVVAPILGVPVSASDSDDVAWHTSHHEALGSFQEFCQTLVDIASSVVASSSSSSGGTLSTTPPLLGKTSNAADFAFAIVSCNGRHSFSHGEAAPSIVLQQAVFPLILSFALEDSSVSAVQGVIDTTRNQAPTGAHIDIASVASQLPHALEVAGALSLATLITPESPQPLRLNSVLSRIARATRLAAVSCDLPMYLSYLQQCDEYQAVGYVLVCLVELWLVLQPLLLLCG
jgi:hypothetical protein